MNSFQVAGAAVDAFASRVSSATARIKADMESARASVFDGGKSIDDILGRTVDLSNKKLGELEFQLAALAEDTENEWARRLLAIIQQVKEGVIDGADVVQSFGDAVILFEGRMQSLTDVLSAYLPSQGEVQRGIRETMELLKQDGVTMEELIDRLGQQHNEYAKIFADLMRGFQAGRISLDAILRAAQEIKKALPGSESDALIDEILQGLRNGTLG